MLCSTPLHPKHHTPFPAAVDEEPDSAVYTSTELLLIVHKTDIQRLPHLGLPHYFTQLQPIRCSHFNPIGNIIQIIFLSFQSTDLAMFLKSSHPESKAIFTSFHFFFF